MLPSDLWCRSSPAPVYLLHVLTMNIKIVLILCLCLLGCVYQVIDISTRYFSYPTKQFLAVKIVMTMPLPAFSICWPMSALFKPIIERKTSSKKQIESTESKRYLLKMMYKLLKTMTVKEIFDLTPQTSEILRPESTCAVRMPGEISWRHPWYNKTECHEIFGINKYIHRMSVCYKFVPNSHDERLTIELNSLSPSKPCFVYIIFFNSSSFINMTAFTAYGHTRSSSPLFDSVFSVQKTIKSNGSPFAIGLISTPITVRSLPAPYDSQCHQMKGFKSGTEFKLQTLNNETMKRMKFVHTLDHVSEPHEYPILTADSLRNATIRDNFLKLYSASEKNGYRPCYFKYNIPKTRLEDDRAINVALAVNWPQDNELYTTTFPGQLLGDFLIYTTSTIGMWLGLSAYSAIDMICDKLTKKPPPEAASVSPSKSLAILSMQVALIKQKLMVASRNSLIAKKRNLM